MSLLYAEISGWAVAVELLFEEQRPTDALQVAILDLVRLGRVTLPQLQSALPGMPEALLRGALDELLVERLHEDPNNGSFALVDANESPVLGRAEGWAFYDPILTKKMLPIIVIGNRPRREVRRPADPDALIQHSGTGRARPSWEVLEQGLRDLALRDDQIFVDSSGMTSSEAIGMRLVSMDAATKRTKQDWFVVPAELRPSLSSDVNIVFWEPDIAVCESPRTRPFQAGSVFVAEAMSEAWEILKGRWRRQLQSHLLPLLQSQGFASLEEAYQASDERVAAELQGAADGPFLDSQLRIAARNALCEAWLVPGEARLRVARAWAVVMELLSQRMLAVATPVVQRWPAKLPLSDAQERLKALGDIEPSASHVRAHLHRKDPINDVKSRIGGHVGVGEALSLLLLTAVVPSEGADAISAAISSLTKRAPGWFPRFDQARRWRDDGTHVRVGDLPSPPAIEACVFDIWRPLAAIR